MNLLTQIQSGRELVWSQAMTVLRGTLCPCGNAKEAETSFCPTCLAKLPQEMRIALDADADYLKSLNRALRFLARKQQEARTRIFGT